MTHRTLLTLSDVINRHEAYSQDGIASSVPAIVPQIAGDSSWAEILFQSHHKAHRHWTAAIAALESLLLSLISPLPETQSKQGLILSGISPILSHSLLVNRFQVGVFTPEAWQHLSLVRLQLPPAENPDLPSLPPEMVELPLFPKDPIAHEQFCLVLTAKFSLLMVLGHDRSELPAFNYSFEPVVVEQGWKILRSRLELTHHPHLETLDRQATAFAPTVPDYRWVMNFGRLMLQLMPSDAPPSDRKGRGKTVSINGKNSLVVDASEENPLFRGARSPSAEVELLQAFTHEIRTPLTTIRTMTRLLLRHKSLTPDMTKRLGIIDQECSEQIDRMELILRATELQTAPSPEKTVQLVPTSLEQVFEQGIPRWQRQAQRRNVDLDIIMPPKLPQVVSDPAMLDQVLTGLLEKFTRSLTQGGQIRVQVSTAGHQLKLQLHSQSSTADSAFKALGQLLLFQPATGSLSLNLDTTKHLCHALGGKLIVRQRSRQGEVITIFLPLGNTNKRKTEVSSL